MTQDRIYAFVEENMKTIFAYACSRVPHKQEAEDLAGDIIAALLAAAGRIRSEEALFGYVWTIAANTYKKYLRRKSRCAAVEWDENRLGEIPDDEDFTETLLQSERLNRLRRELSLLSGQYRECTVAYYFDGLSCAETAEKLHISLEMVKYYLFKTRKILKEGIGMERTFGEKSYKPSRFEFVTIFSGQFNREYRNLFSRKLPGSVLSSAYYTPMTVRELSVELGVAAVYMEDEVALLEKYGLLAALPGGKYQTALVIFTEGYTREFYRSAAGFCTDAVGRILEDVKRALPRLRALGFIGSGLPDDRPTSAGGEWRNWRISSGTTARFCLRSDRPGRNMKRRKRKNRTDGASGGTADTARRRKHDRGTQGEREKTSRLRPAPHRGRISAGNPI